MKSKNKVLPQQFAESHMKKYGWTEGKGLGLDENGIAEPIKVKIKVGTSGVGHDPAQAFTNHWWERAFKNAAEHIQVENDQEGEVCVRANGDGEKATTKIPWKCKSSSAKTSLMYGTFVKSGTLSNGVMHKSESSSSEEEDEASDFSSLTDEQLFKACGGRTAHKGARHGLKLHGKLARLEAQEKQHVLSTELLSVTCCEDTVKKAKKKMARKQVIAAPTNDVEPTTTVPEKARTKRKKSKCSKSDTAVPKTKKNTLLDDDFTVPLADDVTHVNERKRRKKKRKKDSCVV